jgi:hypothetical protein
VALDPAVCAEHPLPQAPDQERILAEQQRLEPGLEVDVDGLVAAPSEDQRVAEPVEPSIRVDHRHHQAVDREVERDGFPRRDAKDEAVDRCDFHGKPPTRTMAATR